MGTSTTRLLWRPWVLASAAVVTALVLLWLNPGARGAKAPCDAGEPQTRLVALGAYIEGAPEDPAKIDAFASMVGRQPSVVMWYQDWATPGVKEFDPARMNAVVGRGAMPMVTWEPADWTRGVDQPNYALATIVRGDHDPYIRGWARDAAAWGKPFYVRFAHEMNGHWYPWSPNVNGNGGPEEYVAAWRHVHAIFEEEGATNVRWVWNPDRTFPDRLSYASLYPGDEYVDWVAIDVYNWGTSQSWSSWRTFPEVFEASYAEMKDLTDKPMMVGETASAESGGDKAAWIRQTFLTDIASRYPRVRAVIWFHRDNSIASQANWRVDSSEGSLGAFREVAASPLYRGQLTVDTVKPTGQVSINDGRTRTSSRTVTLALSATDPSPGSGVHEMRVKNAGSAWSAWQPCTMSKSWRLSRAKGIKSVYVSYKDREGNISETAKDTIRYKR